MATPSLPYSVWLYPRVTPALNSPRRDQSLTIIPLFNPVHCTYSAAHSGFWQSIHRAPYRLHQESLKSDWRWSEGFCYWLIMEFMPKFGHLQKVWILCIWLSWIEILCPLDWPSIPNYFGSGCVWEKFNNNMLSNETLIEVTASCVFSQGAN